MESGGTSHQMNRTSNGSARKKLRISLARNSWTPKTSQEDDSAIETSSNAELTEECLPVDLSCPRLPSQDNNSAEGSVSDSLILSEDGHSYKRIVADRQIMSEEDYSDNRSVNENKIMSEEDYSDNRNVNENQIKSVVADFDKQIMSEEDYSHNRNVSENQIKSEVADFDKQIMSEEDYSHNRNVSENQIKSEVADFDKQIMSEEDYSDNRNVSENQIMSEVDDSKKGSVTDSQIMSEDDNSDEGSVTDSQIMSEDDNSDEGSVTDSQIMSEDDNSDEGSVTDSQIMSEDDDSDEGSVTDSQQSSFARSLVTDVSADDDHICLGSRKGKLSKRQMDRFSEWLVVDEESNMCYCKFCCKRNVASKRYYQSVLRRRICCTKLLNLKRHEKSHTHKTVMNSETRESQDGKEDCEENGDNQIVSEYDKHVCTGYRKEKLTERPDVLDYFREWLVIDEESNTCYCKVCKRPSAGLGHYQFIFRKQLCCTQFKHLRRHEITLSHQENMKSETRESRDRKEDCEEDGDGQALGADSVSDTSDDAASFHGDQSIQDQDSFHLSYTIEQEQVICEHCSASYNTRLQLWTHKHVCHATDLNVCPYCEERLKSFMAMCRHVVKLHRRCKQCPTSVFCGKESHDSHLFKHRHSPYYSFQCPDCDGSFSEAKNLRNHYAKVHKKFLCAFCKMKFRNYHDLFNHNGIYHSEKRYKISSSHLCALCGKIFPTALNLEMHMTHHSSDRPYVCNVCSKSFKLPHHLQTHQLTHSNESSESEIRKYVCDKCGKGFKLPHHLRQHMGTHGIKDLKGSPYYFKHKKAKDKALAEPKQAPSMVERQRKLDTVGKRGNEETTDFLQILAENMWDQPEPSTS